MIIRVLFFLAAALPIAAEQPGPLPNGGELLASGWRLRPAGRQAAVSTLPMSEAVSPDGKYVLVLNGGIDPPSISVLDAVTATAIGRMPVPDAWLGLTFSPRGDRVYVGGGSQAAVFEFTFSRGVLTPARTFPVVPAEKRTPADFIGDVTFDPAGRLLYAAELYRNSIAVINPQSGMAIERFRTGRRPYRILFEPDGKSLFVSSWADGTVYHHDAAKGALLDKIRLGGHPTGMAWLPGTPPAPQKPNWAARLFVAAANTNNVYVAGLTAENALTLVGTINVSMTPWQPAGMTPGALALSRDGKRLFIACSDANAVAVADVSDVETRALGFIPTGRYPTAVRVLADSRLVVLNGKSDTASFIPPPDADQLDQYSQTVLDNSPYRDRLLEDAGTGVASAIPSRPDNPSPVTNVIYIVEESAGAAGPNHDKLAREFARLGSFYALGDAGAEAQDWATAGIASDYVEKMDPNARRLGREGFDFTGAEPAAFPPSGYLWSNAALAGLSLRNYGFFAVNRPAGETQEGVEVASALDPILNRVTNLRFRGPDPAYPDTARAKAFLADLAEFEKTGQMPQLIMMHLAGSGADHDAALGSIVEGVSKSRFWPGVAIFIVPTAAHDGERVPALIVSPFVPRGKSDGTMYNTVSVLRSMELILGLRPMTSYDAGARPMTSVFQNAPDPRNYSAVR
jgi:DNA-binding beta-propeller fold protein YncE